MSTVTDFEWFYNAISNATFQSCTEDSSKILGAADTALDPLFCSYLQGKQQANLHGIEELISLGWAAWNWIQA